MGSLEDQLKKWKQQTKPQQASPSSASPSSPTRKAPTKKDPFPKQVMRKEPAPAQRPAPPKKSDAELFAEAVAAVDADVVLEKFSPAPRTTKKENAPPPPTDEELFVQFVGQDNVAAEQDGGQKARLVRLKK